MKYTPQRVNKIKEALEKGLSVTGVCGLVGISRETFYHWIKTKPDFSDMVTEAQALFEQVLVDIIQTNARTALQLAERRYREEYRPPGVKITLAPAEGSGLDIRLGEED